MLPLRLQSMKNTLKKYGLLVWLSLILLTGFMITLFTGFIASRTLLLQQIAEQTLPVTSDAVVAEIQKEILRPVLIASQMAGNTFVRDWMSAGEEDQTQITRYLKEIKAKNNAVSVFLASGLTHRHYHASGTPKNLSETDARDAWFARMRNQKTPYETSVDADAANHDSMMISVRHRITDENKNFIGVAGIGFASDTVRNLIDQYQNRFHRKIYLADTKGNILLTGSNAGNIRGNLAGIDGMQALAPRILANRKNESLHLEYSSDAGSVQLSARFLPELGWHLLAEQDTGSDIQPLQNVFLMNLAISAAVMLLVIAIAWRSIRRYQKKLETSAETDTLTKLLNRHAFDFVFQQALLDSERSRQPMCAALIDIDLFKKINDKHGHLVGDHVLREIAAICRRSLRESDILCRWGGEEFLVLLKNCTLEKATSIAENLRNTIASNDFSRTTDLLQQKLTVTVSMGVAECKDRETEDSVFERADQALYQAKTNGRNSVYFSE